ncbi:hypothetical protein R3I94_013978 [Phoxinus phoxinus]
MSESVSLFGGRVPAEVELLCKHLKNLHRDTFTQILGAVVKGMEGQDSCECVQRISESGLISEESLNRVMAGLYALLKEALRRPALRHEVFSEDLRALRVPEELLPDVSSVVFGNRLTSVSARHPEPSLAKMEEFKWRVDVAISTSSLARALQPSILMQIKLSDGHVHRFQVPVVKFQKLRYNVSLMLKEMNDVEKRSILRIQD